ncbi:MAG: hypothetical protein AB1921_06765 [Thermodesulfobacteriota bacterium]
MERSIIHVNVADFAVAVERRMDARLAGRPLVVAQERAARAAVYDMSEEAFRAGVRKGMLLFRARKLCREALVVPPRPDLYERAMAAMAREALCYTPLLEPGEADGHLFLDVTGTCRLFGPPVDVAWRLSRRVRADLGIRPIWSVAPNKLVAKAATRAVKPEGEYIVGAGEEEAFLAPLPLSFLPGLARDDLVALSRYSLTLACHVAAWDHEELCTCFGRRGPVFHDLVRGCDASPVLPAGKKPPAVSAERVFDEDINERPAMEGVLYTLCEQAAADLRKRIMAAGRVRVHLEHTDGLRRASSSSLAPPGAGDRALFDAALQALEKAWSRRVRVRRLTLCCEKLSFPPAQYELFPDPENTRDLALSKTFDAIRNRYGNAAIQTGRTLAA